jgi:hypothetical protein
VDQHNLDTHPDTFSFDADWIRIDPDPTFSLD